MDECTIKMAKEAGFDMPWLSHEEHQCIERLVELSRAAEREECAKLCDELVIEVVGNSALAVDQCARAIRARSQQ